MKAAISPRSRSWASPCWSSPSRWCSPSTRSRCSAPIPARDCATPDRIVGWAKRSVPTIQNSDVDGWWARRKERLCPPYACSDHRSGHHLRGSARRQPDPGVRRQRWRAIAQWLILLGVIPHGEEALLRRLEPRGHDASHPSRRGEDAAPQDEVAWLPLHTTNPIRLDLGLEAVERGRGRCAVNGIFSLRQQRQHLQVDRGRMMNDIAVIVQIVGYLARHAKIVKRDIRKQRQSRKRIGGEIVNRL